MTTENVFRFRLLTLANFLDTLPRKRFDYSRWVGAYWKGKPDLSCGTTACALGWATTVPEFRKLGLVLQHQTLRGKSTGRVRLRNPKTGEMLEESMAANAVFGVDYFEFQYLFYPSKPAPFRYHTLADSPNKYSSPRTVAKHIRRFVEVKYPWSPFSWKSA